MTDLDKEIEEKIYDILKKYHFDCSYKIVADRAMFYKLYFDDNIVFQYINMKVAYYSTDGISSLQIKKRTLEDIEVMKKYDIPQIAIINFEANYEKYYKYKKIFKKVFMKFGLMKIVREMSGWKKMNNY